MYSKQEIAYLMKSGYTMQEIMALDGVAGDPAPETPAPAPETPAPAPAPETPAPAPAPAGGPGPDPNAGVLAAIEKLTQTIQAGNIRAGGFPAPNPENSAETILANIINPPGYTAGKNK